MRSSICSGTAVRAFDFGPQAWDGWLDIDGAPPLDAQLCYGDIADFETVCTA